MNGLRLGTPEIVRLGMDEGDMSALASFIVRALAGESVASEVTTWRGQFTGVHFTACPGQRRGRSAQPAPRDR